MCESRQYRKRGRVRLDFVEAAARLGRGKRVHPVSSFFSRHALTAWILLRQRKIGAAERRKNQPLKTTLRWVG